MMASQSQPASEKQREEFRIFVERLMHFMNLWTVYTDLLSGRYVPAVNLRSESKNDAPTEVWATMMFMLYGFFYSLIEDDEDSVNAFRVWRQHYPEEEKVIAAVETQVVGFRPALRKFRNRLGFHGSRTRTHEAPGLDLFSQHSGTEMWNAMKNFKSLGAALLAKDNASKGGANCSNEDARRWIDAIDARVNAERHSA